MLVKLANAFECNVSELVAVLDRYPRRGRRTPAERTGGPDERFLESASERRTNGAKIYSWNGTGKRSHLRRWSWASSHEPLSRNGFSTASIIWLPENMRGSGSRRPRGVTSS